MATPIEQIAAVEPLPDEPAIERLAAGDEYAVRDALIELAATKAERERVAAALAYIADRYSARVHALKTREDELRASVQTYLERFNDGKGVSFPDVGTAYLTTRNKGGKVKVTDAELLGDHIDAGGLPVPYGPAPVDAEAALALILDERDLRPTKDGRLVTEAGEVVDVPGLEVLPESKTLGVRSA
jgi:hypothetical protein